MQSGGYNPVTKGSLTQLMNQLINDEGVCRSAPATPGLINTSEHSIKKFCKSHLIFKPVISKVEYFS